MKASSTTASAPPSSNTVKEQQAQIAAPQKQIDELKALNAENAELRAQIAAILARLPRADSQAAKQE